MRHIKIAKEVAFVTFKEWAAYRSHAMVSMFVGPCYYLVQICIWKSLFPEGQTIGGMTFEQMLAYFGIIGIIGYITMDFADWNLGMLVRTGKFLTFALRPIHHRFFALSQKIGHRILGFVYEFIPVLLIFVFVFKVNLMPAHFGWFILSLALAFLMNFYINYSLGLLSFWTTQTGGISGVFNLLGTVCSGALIPLSLFPEAVQRISVILPFQYITYVPASVFMGKYTLAGLNLPIPQIVLYQAVAVLIMLLVSEVLYRLALRQFTGVGV